MSIIVNAPEKILVTGATGYVGGRLVPRLLDAGYRVRVLVRDPARLQGRPWLGRVEVIQGDVFKPDSLASAMAGIDTTYYLIHSMSHQADFHEQDLAAARNFGRMAKEAGVQRIIYLGGLGDPDSDLSEHLRSRQQTGQALQESGVPVIEFRAAVIVGSGSLSFEMIRYLTERIPIMICPKWVYTRVQPIAVRNVLEYLEAALLLASDEGLVLEIGGQDILTYGEMMEQYAEIRGLHRLLLPVPVLTPRLSSHWVHWMTPVPAAIASPLIQGLRNEVIVRDDTAQQLFPAIQPLGYREAVQRALDHLEAKDVETSWTDALTTSQGSAVPVVFTTQEGMMIEKRQLVAQASPADVFAVFTGVGGDRGWPAFNWAWRLRGILDRLVGGVGFRRGRRDPDDLRVGDALDFWRVEAVDPNRLLRLRAEMKLPGRAWLQFEATALDDSSTRLSQTAFFASKGLIGLLYWYALYPFHGLIFSRMIQNLVYQAEQQASLTPDIEPSTTPS